MLNSYRLTLLAAVCASMLGSAQSRAADVVADDASTIRFVLESQSGYTWLDGNAVESDEDDSFSTTGGVGRVNFDLSNGFNIQGDLFGEYAWLNDSADDSYESQIGGGLHTYWRSDVGAFGIFGALGDVGIAGEPGGFNYIAGAEAQFYSDSWTFYLQGGFMDGDRGDDVDLIRDAVFVRGVGKYYFDANTLLQADAAFATGEMDLENDDVDIFSVGARVQHRFDFWPGAFFVGYRGDFADQDEAVNNRIDSHTVLFGSTYTFGSDSLQDNERRGAAMDLPAFMRWQGIAAGQLE